MTRRRAAPHGVARGPGAARPVGPARAVLLLLSLAAATQARAAAMNRPGAAAPVPVAAHDATYDLTLASTHGGGTVGASGTMSFGITDTCDGWSSRQVLHLSTVTREGQNSDLVSSYATLESKDGHHLRFDMLERDDGAVTQQVRGEAETFPDGTGEARYTLPAVATVKLPRGTLFPMAHTEAIIRAAAAGRKAAAFPLFDGTSADGASDTYVTVLNWSPAPSASPYPTLAALPSGRVHVSFFSRKPDTVTPDYEVGMRYFADGVSDRLSMDFGDFTMAGALRTFAPAKPAKC